MRHFCAVSVLAFLSLIVPSTSGAEQQRCGDLLVATTTGGPKEQTPDSGSGGPHDEVIDRLFRRGITGRTTRNPENPFPKKSDQPAPPAGPLQNPLDWPFPTKK